jgi:formate hydrogenlyase subunit 6/NADH:ubiquinone oxidoreductase subunit I
MGVAKTNYTLRIDVETCLGCGLCQKACNVAALEMVESENGKRKKTVRIIGDNCLGCGACISVCPSHSLSLVYAAGRPLPPEKKKDLFKQILKEKKKLTPFIIDAVKSKIRRSLRMG